MAPKKKKRPAQGQSSDDVAVQDAPDSVNGNGPAPRKHVTDTPFSIDMVQKLSAHPYHDSPQQNTIVHIRPQSIWASLTKYHTFVLQEQTYAVHHHALITRFQPLPKRHDPLDQDAAVPCLARILEIRALDSKNVYIRLYWFQSPEQTPGGRQPYHGKNELIATNHMEIVDAERVIRRVEVHHWTDEHSAQLPIDAEGEYYYWRQTFHILTKRLSPLPTHCICSHPLNPSTPPLTCPNPHCRLRLHTTCIINAALTSFRLRQQSDLPIATVQPPFCRSSTIHEPAAAGANDDFKVEVIVSARPHQQGRKRLACWDASVGRMWEQDILCLKCGAKVW
ncbi:MAG: hypothetical protein Q9186_002237 [Xanthomendoza sp. 1 TL-2023]